MSRPRFAALLLMALSLQAAGCDAALASTIHDPELVVLPDPVLSKSVRFPASAATAGAARVSPALDQVNIRTSACSPRNPCALAAPAGPDAVAAQPPRQRLSKNRRVRRAG